MGVMPDYAIVDLELSEGGPLPISSLTDEDFADSFIGSSEVDEGSYAMLKKVQSEAGGAAGVTQATMKFFKQVQGQIFNETWQRLCNLTNSSGSFSPSWDVNGTSVSGVFLCAMESNNTNPEEEYSVPLDYSDAAAMERILSIVVPILFGLIVLVGLFGNALVVIVVLCNPQMRSTTNLLIINLAMADLLFIVFCVPFTAWDYALPYWPFGDAWCRVVQYLVIVCAYASIYTLVLMSLDRFLAVVHPIASMSYRTERNAYIAIIFTWVVILVSCIPALEAHGETGYTFAMNHYSVCIFLASKGYNYAAFQIAFFLSSYIVPLTIIFVLYLLMLKRLWFGVVPGGHVSAESVRSKKRVTRLVVVVVVIFAVCWCPIQIVLVLKSVEAYELSPGKIVLQIAAHVLAYMNSCVNPILYAFLSENFRKAFRKVISCSPHRSGLPRRDDFERSERETTKNTKVCNDIL